MECRLAEKDQLSNSRYLFEQESSTPDQVKSELKADEGRLKAARHLPNSDGGKEPAGRVAWFINTSMPDRVRYVRR